MEERSLEDSIDSIRCRLVKLCGGQDSISPEQERMIESIIAATENTVLEESLSMEVWRLEQGSMVPRVPRTVDGPRAIAHSTCNFALLGPLLSNDAYMKILERIFVKENLQGIFYSPFSPLYVRRAVWYTLPRFSRVNSEVYRLVVRTLASECSDASLILVRWMACMLTGHGIDAENFGMMWDIMIQEGIDTTQPFDYVHTIDDVYTPFDDITLVEHVLILADTSVAKKMPQNTILAIASVLFEKLEHTEQCHHTAKNKDNESPLSLLEAAHQLRPGMIDPTELLSSAAPKEGM